MEPILYGAIAGVATLFGILLVLRWEKWAVAHSHFVNSLAAGVILGLVFLSLIPEALELSGQAIPFVFAGFLVLYLLETFVVVHSGTEIHYHTPDARGHAGKAYTMFAGLALHSVVDGVVIGAGFEVNHRLGLLAALGVILHELPEGATSFALLAGRVSRRTALILSVIVAVATPVGAAVAAFVLPGLSQTALGAILAIAAGSFLYVGASDLVPETHERKGWLNAVCLLLGACLAYALLHSFEHGH